MEKILKNAFKELVAAIGGLDNILAFGYKKSDDKKQISLHLRRNDVVKHDAFVFFEGVYCLEQSQGISLLYEKSEEMGLFYTYLFETCGEKNVAFKAHKVKRQIGVTTELKIEKVEKLVRKRKVTRKKAIDY